MKRAYNPIDIPSCLCGQMPHIRNRIASHTHASRLVGFREAFDENGNFVDGSKLRIVKLPLWICGCVKCRIAGKGGTKREAVEAFRREVEINVTG